MKNGNHKSAGMKQLNGSLTTEREWKVGGHQKLTRNKNMGKVANKKDKRIIMMMMMMSWFDVLPPFTIVTPIEWS